VKNWHKTDYEIVHDEGKYFAVIAVAVQADNREVASWTQPLVKPQESGIVAYLVRNINGVLHFLVQAKVEAGNFDVVEMAPTVQCVTGNYKDEKSENLPPFLEYVLNVPPEQIRFSTFQSEEGGRFYQEENKNMLIEVGDDFLVKVPDNYIWMTMGQIKDFIRYNNFFNVEARCLLSGLGFI
jgi:oxidase EvaA